MVSLNQSDRVLSVGRLRHHLNFSRSSKDLSPWRTSTWSSARMIRVGIVTSQWKSNGNFSSVAQARFDLQRSADRADAFAHGDKPQPLPGQSLAAAHFKSSTIVPDVQHCVKSSLQARIHRLLAFACFTAFVNASCTMR